MIGAEILDPFSASFNLTVNQLHEGQPENESVGIVELSLADAADACEKGEILLLPVDQLAGTSDQRVIEDFVPNTLQPCAVGHSVWSSVAVFNKSRFLSNERPHLIADFFDIGAYPGKRIIHRSPQTIVEWALVASGIPSTKVYEALNSSEHAWSLIEKKLRAIEEHIIWVDSDSQAIDFLRSGVAAFAILNSDSVVRETMQRDDVLGVLWDAAVTDISLWAIPTEAENPEISWEFIQYAVSVNNSGKVASVFGYSPVRYSTLMLMDRSYQEILPTWPDNQLNLVWSNAKWWRDSSEKITERFAQWVDDIEVTPEIRLAAVSKGVAESELGAIDGAMVYSEKYLPALQASVPVIGRLAN